MGFEDDPNATGLKCEQGRRKTSSSAMHHKELFLIMRVLFYYSGGEHLGIESISSYLKEKGHTVDLLFDPGLGNNFYFDLPFLNKFINGDMLIRKAKRFNPDIIAISCVTNLYPAIKRIAGKLKGALNVPIVVGGIHPTSIPDDVIKEECFDIVCIGEGEEALAELADKIEKKESYLDIRNLWIKDEKGVVHKNPLRPLIKDLNKLPFPDKSIFHKYGAIAPMLVMTGRGCPYQCTFCVNNFRKNLYPKERYLRTRNVDRVIEELIELKKRYKMKYVKFEDDVFAWDLKWLKEFREKYNRHINLPFSCYLSPLNVKEEIIAELKKAGCVSISIGIQSGNERIRRELLKRYYTNEQILKSTELIKSFKIELSVEFIFGFPTETPKEMWEAFYLNEKIKPYYTGTFIFYPFPKTELAEYCLRTGCLSKEKYNLIKQGFGSYHLSCLLDHPFKNDIYKFKTILPIYTRAPKILKPLVKKMLSIKYGRFYKLLYLLSVPLLNCKVFFYRLVQIPVMLYKTRKELKN
jgi:radical SAM superfamily enzyme YgiQ (UPF0313 family)